MSERRRNLRHLRNVSKRLIIETYKNHKSGKLNIISAGTGTGKTYSIAHSLIPSDIETGINKFLFLTVFRDNVDQDYVDLTKALRGKADVVRTVDEFINSDNDFPCVLVSTIQGAAVTNNEVLTEYLMDNTFSVYWDEAHFGGSSSSETYKPNTSFDGYGYNATYYKFVETLAKIGKVTGFTATPLFEQRGLLGNLNSGMYHFLTDLEDWATIQELSELGSQTKEILIYNSNTTVGFENGIKTAINNFRSFSEYQKLLAEQISSVHSELYLTPKTIMLCNGGADIENSISSLKIAKMVDFSARELANVEDNDAHIFGRVDKDGYVTASINMILSGKDWKRTKGFASFVAKMKNSKDPLKYVFHLEKFKFGLNVSNISHEIHVRERNQKVEIKVTVSHLQIFGRAIRTFFGIENLNINYVSDAVNWLLDNYSNSSVFEELKEYMKLSNSHTFIVPRSESYNVACAQWSGEDGYAYAASLDQSQFNIDSTGNYLKGYSTMSKSERKLAYKKYKEKVRFCEKHPEGSCNNENRDKFSELTDGEYEEAYWKALHVDHINGDREDMREENLMTCCATFHGIKTYVNKDHLNSYE